MEITSLIAQHVMAAKYECLPAATVEVAKKDILDTWASALAGTMDPTCRDVVGLVKQWGGIPESTIVAFGGGVPSPDAAFLNSLAAHILDLTDAHEGSATRAGVTIVPTAFAVAEARGGVSGTELITAVAVGLDLVCRLSLAATSGLGGSGFLISSITGVFGAAATSAKLLGLNYEQTVNALGIAYSQAAGNMQAYDDKTFVTRLQNGFAAKAGILSGRLAQIGVSGAHNIFSGRYGFYHIYEKDQCDLTQITRDLGAWYECDNLSFKPYPSMRSTHAPIDAAIAIVRENKFSVKDVAAVTVRLKKRFFDLLCVPLEERRAPKTRVAALTSLPYLIAVAVCRGDVGVEHLSDDALSDKTVREISEMVLPIMDPALDEDKTSQTGPAIVEIALKDGRRFIQKISHPKGGPQNPMSLSEVGKKMEKCAKFAFSPVAPDNLEHFINLCMELEKSPETGKLLGLLTAETPRIK